LLGEQIINGHTYKSFIVQLFNVKQIDKITRFRRDFYNKIMSHITKINPKITQYEEREEIISGKKFHLLFYKPNDKAWTDDNGIYEHPLFAIPDYYWGHSVWTPHISLAKITSGTSNTIFQTILSSPNTTAENNAKSIMKNTVNYSKINFKIYQNLIKNVTLE